MDVQCRSDMCMCVWGRGGGVMALDTCEKTSAAGYTNNANQVRAHNRQRVGNIHTTSSDTWHWKRRQIYYLAFTTAHDDD